MHFDFYTTVKVFGTCIYSLYSDCLRMKQPATSRRKVIPEGRNEFRQQFILP